MDALLDFLHMGGYAFYVWTAYGIVTIMLAVNLVIPLRRDRDLRERLRRRLADRGARPAGDAEDVGA